MLSGEEAVDGVCANAGLSIEASQYSSEIINTQVSSGFELLRKVFMCMKGADNSGVA